jgi:hypothetical protein
MYTWVSTEFINMEFPRRNGILSTPNSADTEFRQFFLPPYIQYAMVLFIFFPTLMEFRIQKYAEFCGIPWNFANFNSQSLQYVRIWVFKYKFVRIKS